MTWAGWIAGEKPLQATEPVIGHRRVLLSCERYDGQLLLKMVL